MEGEISERETLFCANIKGCVGGNKSFKDTHGRLQAKKSLINQNTKNQQQSEKRIWNHLEIRTSQYLQTLESRIESLHKNYRM